MYADELPWPFISSSNSLSATGCLRTRNGKKKQANSESESEEFGRASDIAYDGSYISLVLPNSVAQSNENTFIVHVSKNEKQ